MVGVQFGVFMGRVKFLDDVAFGISEDSKRGREEAYSFQHQYYNYIQNILEMFQSIKYENVSSLYSKDQSGRYEHLLKEFERIYSTKPQFIARAPGRVNIIGQHIDYEGYGVLPAAIEKDCLIAVRKTSSQIINLHHVKHELYPSTSIPVDPNENCQFINNYVKYFRAGYRAGVKQIPANQLSGLDLLIQGNVPPAAGVSSSSALCVCSALLAVHANNVTKTISKKQDFIQRVIVGQRQTGTASGGMDQSISVMGKVNFCLYIQFNPIRCTPVHLPEGSRFVIMNSLVQSAKLNTAVYRYNKRVCQCRIAINILAKKLNIPIQNNKHLKILKQLQEWSNLPLNTLGSLVDKYIQRKDYSLQQIQKIIEQPVIDILGDIQLHKEVIEANKTYKIYEAARHVFDEAYRVINFVEVCKSKLQSKDKLILLGKLMNQSQASCRDLYECSCPQIDQITVLACKNGAYGSRLTGAGWGGCTVSLVDAGKSQSFIKAMIQQYYDKQQNLFQKIKAIGIENVVFESIPSEGACIIEL